MSGDEGKQIGRVMVLPSRLASQLRASCGILESGSEVQRDAAVRGLKRKDAWKRAFLFLTTPPCNEYSVEATWQVRHPTTSHDIPGSH